MVYLDSVFLCNALLDYLLVLLSARLAGVRLRRVRYALCGLLGGLYAAAVFLPGGAFLTAAPVKAAVGVLLSLTAFGRETHFWRLTLLTFAVACALAGSVLALGLLAGQSIPNARGIFYTDVDARTLLLSAAGIYLVFSLVFRASAAHGLRGELLPAAVCLLGRTVHLTALRDTGSSLRDAAGDPVLTAEAEMFPALAEAAGHLPAAEALPLLRTRFPDLCPQLLPVRTAAGDGLLLSVRCDWAEVDGTRYPGLRIALTQAELGSGYTALWGGEGRKHHESDCVAEGTAAPAGTAAKAEHSLYRRQRYPAAAADKRAGSGAAGASGGRIGSAGGH